MTTPFSHQTTRLAYTGAKRCPAMWLYVLRYRARTLSSSVPA